MTLGRRVTWHERRLERAQTILGTATVLAPYFPEGATGDLVVSSTLRYANPASWHERDIVRSGEVVGWDSQNAQLLVDSDDGTWAQVPILAIRREERR